MKICRIATIIIFYSLLLLPIFTFNWKENVISEIDNRKLMNNPFGEYYNLNGESRDLTDDNENYIQDRIGFRDKMILGYTLLNDKLFHKMVHPTYDYGKEGYVFFKTGRNKRYGEYEKEFANYCVERGVPFVFVFNPSKTTVLSDKLREGINYDSGWTKEFKKELDRLGVYYVDNTELLEEKTAEGEVVFNKVYNAGHWNDLGAFYGCNEVLKNLQKYFPNLHINLKEDYYINENLNTSLQVSEYPIYEYEPVFTSKIETDNIAERYYELAMHPQYQEFEYYINSQRISEGAPKALSFQGSYMNGMGYKFLSNSFGEYICVQDYENVLNLDYYFNIFQPDCVIFETAEYTLTPNYYNLEEMKEVNFNPGLETEKLLNADLGELSEKVIEIEEGEELVVIEIKELEEDTLYAYLIIGDKQIDLKKSEGGYKATIEKKELEGQEIEIFVEKVNGTNILYQ